MTSVVLQLDYAARSGDRAEIADAREAVRASLEGVRGIARRLRPEALDDLGLPSALAALTNDVAGHARLPIDRWIAPGCRRSSPTRSWWSIAWRRRR